MSGTSIRDLPKGPKVLANVLAKVLEAVHFRVPCTKCLMSRYSMCLRCSKQCMSAVVQEMQDRHVGITSQTLEGSAKPGDEAELMPAPLSRETFAREKDPP